MLVSSQISLASQKEKLLECIRPLERGLVSLTDSAALSDVTSKIEALEASNPSPRPVEDARIFGDWRTIYTTSQSILGAKRPKFLQPNIVAQVIAQTESGEIGVTNVETIDVLGFSIVNNVTAIATPDGDKRVNVQFQRFQLANGLYTTDVSKNPRFANWLDTTYLDEDIRISRGGEGNVFVLVRAGDDAPALPI